MTAEDFLRLLSRFAERPVPATGGRHVYLWHGDLDRLEAALPGGVLQLIDLHVLAAALTQAPRSTDAVRRLLLQSLRAHLTNMLSGEGQQVVVVTGCDLLSRYLVPLTPFFEAASDRTAVVFVVSPEETHFGRPTALPDYVSIVPQTPFDYLRSMARGPIVVNADEVSL
ncbi:MAG: hypothetical protein GX601_19470 [Anaerolineales bacterium]|nr:hypothetical protein [Anaerolineales bacterium]